MPQRPVRVDQSENFAAPSGLDVLFRKEHRFRVGQVVLAPQSRMPGQGPNGGIDDQLREEITVGSPVTLADAGRMLIPLQALDVIRNPIHTQHIQAVIIHKDQ